LLILDLIVTAAGQWRELEIVEMIGRARCPSGHDLALNTRTLLVTAFRIGVTVETHHYITITILL
jgi:hypothetical protein